MTAPQQFEYDVFLSHATADKPAARGLAERLKADGLRVWLDEWAIHPGDAIPLAIEQGLETSRSLVLLMSQAAFDSEWVSLERHTALFRDPTNQLRRFIPVLLDNCDVPDSLKLYHYIDARGGDLSAVATKVAVAISGGVTGRKTNRFGIPPLLLAPIRITQLAYSMLEHCPALDQHEVVTRIPFEQWNVKPSGWTWALTKVSNPNPDDLEVRGFEWDLCLQVVVMIQTEQRYAADLIVASSEHAKSQLYRDRLVPFTALDFGTSACQNRPLPNSLRQSICNNCGGRTLIQDECLVCSGTGTLPNGNKCGCNYGQVNKNCPTCNGTGNVICCRVSGRRVVSELRVLHQGRFVQKNDYFPIPRRLETVWISPEMKSEPKSSPIVIDGADNERLQQSYKKVCDYLSDLRSRVDGSQSIHKPMVDPTNDPQGEFRNIDYEKASLVGLQFSVRAVPIYRVAYSRLAETKALFFPKNNKELSGELWLSGLDQLVINEHNEFQPVVRSMSRFPELE